MTKDKILNISDLIEKIKTWKQAGLKVVFTNGCFDILHLGHIDYLEKARHLGDKLVVGLNSDSSVRRLKGVERPINPEYARARVLAALEFVDAVCVFEEDTPKSLIEKIYPDILTKGSDYTLENIVGADFVMSYGGQVKTIDLVEGFSTTQILDKAKNSL
ncbi:D-glycero-beta-D-manno-heptose 1-phosphate adenylyltransferase [Raineya orbicola]|uniref:D-glycero-beta-D-manno-heptose 1-phosphate adenylyltransferase n=1 Tax=Raineya orbicola TaxID=2016530 RepID=A0A2N3II21_9BACT|nr:D-glycero-beta-D-manno-heptose 1-phosphate adenylyltransferase [Raineya orbicola]PKQ69975.1 Bifunctional protein RfaE, domain II [Raineya orbicola]